MTQVSFRAAVPAPARDLVQAQSGHTGGDSVGGVATSAVEAQQSRLEKLRQSVQNGTYQPDPRQVSQSIINQHLDKA